MDRNTVNDLVHGFMRADAQLAGVMGLFLHRLCQRGALSKSQTIEDIQFVLQTRPPELSDTDYLLQAMLVCLAGPDYSAQLPEEQKPASWLREVIEGGLSKTPETTE